MNDLMSRLSALHHESPAPDEATVTADVRRGRRAVRRHRAVRGITGGAVALAVAGTAVAVHGSGGPTMPEASGPDTTISSGGSNGTAIHLVDYAGPQKPGFTVRTVPEGFVLQGVRPTVLDITRPGDASSLYSFAGKVVVMLQSQDATFERVGTKVSVNGRPGYIHGDPGGDDAADGSTRPGEDVGTATTLEFLDGSGHDVLVQAWDDLGLTDQQLVQLAEGITVTSQAVAPVG